MDYSNALRRGAPRGSKARSALGVRTASSPPEKRLKLTPNVSNDAQPNAEAKRVTRSTPRKVKTVSSSKAALPPKPKPKPKPRARRSNKATAAVVQPARSSTASKQVTSPAPVAEAALTASPRSNSPSPAALTVADDSSVVLSAAARVSTNTAVISALSTVVSPTIIAEDVSALSAAVTTTIVETKPAAASSAEVLPAGAASPDAASNADASQVAFEKPAVASSSDSAKTASAVDQDSASGPTNSAPDDPNVAAIISYILSAPKGSGSNLLFPEAVHARLKELLPEQDLSKLIELPADFLNCSEVLAPLLAPGAKSIEARFDNFIAIQRHLLAASPQGDDSGQPDFIFSVAMAKSFFESEGSIHGSKTSSHQCDDDNCTTQSCCPKEYNFSSVETYAARLATRFPEFAGTFASKEFKKFVKAGLERQQTDGRHAMQAPPILEPHAETIAAEAYAAIRKFNDIFRASKGRPRAEAAFHACRDAQDLARFVIDLAIGFRAADLSATLTKDVYVSGVGADRRYSAMQRTAKVLVPVKVWSARSRAGSLLDPVRVLDFYLATCHEFGLPIGTLCNGRDGEPLCSPYLFPWICQDPDSGYPMVTPKRPKRNAKMGSKWEKASSSQCNAWLKRMLSLLSGSIRTEYTFHGTRAVSALVALANNRSIESINQQQGWRDRSDMANRYARLVQLQCMAQQPVLRDNLADTLSRDYKAFFG